MDIERRLMEEMIDILQSFRISFILYSSLYQYRTHFQIGIILKKDARNIFLSALASKWLKDFERIFFRKISNAQSKLACSFSFSREEKNYRSSSVLDW